MKIETGLVTTTLADQVEEKVIQYIKDNKMVPGDSLPNEKQFSEMLGISRSVVREALSRLRMLGLIQSRTKRGIIITEPPLLNGLRKVLDPNLFSIKTIKEMMGMRIAVEMGLAEFLFANITESNILELEQIVSRQEVLGVNNLSVQDEMLFHSKIYEVSGNNFILQLNEIMHPIFEFSKMNYESYFLPVNEKLVQRGALVMHSDLLDYIRRKDKEGYRQAIRNHLQPYWEFIYNFEKE